MKKIALSEDWRFCFPASKEWVTVDLPHDYAIQMPRSPLAQGGASNGFFQGGIGKYVKFLPPEEDHKHRILDIDGAYMCTAVSLNGTQLVMHPHGYTPFLTDLTAHWNGKVSNKLEISTNALQPSTRWYSGAGLYRDVFLWESGDNPFGARIEPWDVFVTTPALNSIQASFALACDEDVCCELCGTVCDDRGNLVAEKTVSVRLTKEEKKSFSLSWNELTLRPWSLEDPYRYTFRTALIKDGVVLDEDERPFGVRTVSADALNGLLLNGKPVKMRGGCIHHDHGAVGAGEFPAACRRKLQLLQGAGYNALRIAHNPPSSVLMELCDEMGILVMDEAFDMWNMIKGGEVNYHLWFNDWWQRDLYSMVMRDRSHPCVIAYSLGNEIPESNGTSGGENRISTMAEYIRSLDNTRFVTSATYRTAPPSCENDAPDYKEQHLQKYGTGIQTWKERTASYWAPLDICGYNYMYLHYEEDHEAFPHRVIWGSETHALNFYHSWKKTEKYPYVIGDFTWTAYDNLGEAGTGRFAWASEGVINGISVGPYPWRSCYQGDFDLCGYRRPQSYFREAVWLGNTEPKIFTTHPKHYGEGFTGTAWHWYDVHETWSYDDQYAGKPVRCEVYTDADEIRWFLNDRPVGTSVPQEAIAFCDIPYEKGTLTAVAYKNGTETGRSSLATAGSEEVLHIEAETKALCADGRDLCYLRISLTDEKGVLLTDQKQEITCTVTGGELVCVFSGDPCNEDEYTSDHCHLFEGRALAVIRTKQAGKISVTVRNEHKTATAEIDGV